MYAKNTSESPHVDRKVSSLSSLFNLTIAETIALLLDLVLFPSFRQKYWKTKRFLGESTQNGNVMSQFWTHLPCFLKQSEGLKLLIIIAISTIALVKKCFENRVLGLIEGCLRLAINCWSVQRNRSGKKLLLTFIVSFRIFTPLISFLKFSPTRWSCVFCFFLSWRGDQKHIVHIATVHIVIQW